MLARNDTFTAPPVEIDIEGVGPYRLPNMWEGQRIRHMPPGPNRALAPLAFGCGMTVRQFRKLPADRQEAVRRAYFELLSPSDRAIIPAAVDDSPAVRFRSRLSESQKLQIGRLLVQAKAALPHGHFGPWVEEKGLSRSMALQCMALAKFSDGVEAHGAV